MAVNEEKQTSAVKPHDEKKLTVKETCKTMRVSKPTLYKYIDAARHGMTD